MSKILDRSLDILFALAKTEKGMAVGQLASAVSIPISTVYRILQELQRRGLVRCAGEGCISLGPALLDLGRAARSQIAVDLPSLALPFMQQLSQSTEETSLLTVPSAFGAVCVEAVNSPRPIRLSFERGRVLPFHAGASAVTLLAHMDQATVQRVLAASREEHYADGKPIDAQALERSLQESRRKGFTITHGEVDPGATAIGVPILSDQGVVLAALTLAGPSSRFDDRRLPDLIDQTVRAAQGVQAHLHGISL